MHRACIYTIGLKTYRSKYSNVTTVHKQNLAAVMACNSALFLQFKVWAGLAFTIDETPNKKGNVPQFFSVIYSRLVHKYRWSGSSCWRSGKGVAIRNVKRIVSTKKL